MHIARRPSLLLALLALLPACSRGPTREEALVAIRTALPALDTATIRVRVWRDGPPWFSCAEVNAKLRSGVDSAVVRGPLDNWQSLVKTGWVAMKDSAAGVVADPGWCTLRITPAGLPNVARWTPASGPPFPTGQPRRAWIVFVGRQQLLVPSAPSGKGADSATAAYAVTVAPNTDGVAVGADRDTAWFVAQLRKVDGGWRAISSRRVQREP